MITWTENSRLCPPPETVRKYLEGWTDEVSSLQIEEHLGLCDACSVSVEHDRSPSDHWLKAIRSETIPASDEAIPIDGKSTSEDLDPIAEQAIERSKRILQDEGAIVPSIPGKLFSNSIPTLGEIGPYELIRPIGQGGMGYVMLARHKHLDKEVAVKILPSTPWRIPTEEARFQREIRAVGKLEHPSIVTALDAGEYQGTHFLAMEFVDGLDLSRLTKAIGPLPIPDACELIRQSALGLSYAHAQGIVHRDVKPSNLMLDRSGRIKILDFGLAQLQPWDDGCADLTSVGQLMGTLDYMAPEQAEHGGAVSYRADLYSLGATLFRLLVGRAPLAITPTQTPIEKLRLLSDHPIPRLKTMLPDAPDGLCCIVDSLLSRDPSQRPPSAAHLAESLEPWAKGADLASLLKRAQSIASQATESHPTSLSLVASQRMAQASSVGTSTLPRTQPSRGRSYWNWILWTAAGLLAPLSAYGGFLIYLETQKGQIVVESELAEVRVRVVADGKEVDELQLSQGASSIRLRAGKYELFIDSPTDSITMSNQAFVLKKGETIVARIHRDEKSGVRNNADLPSVVASPPSKADVPQYDGKSLSEWLGILDRERALDPVAESLQAIRGLATPNDRESIRKPLNEQIQRFSNSDLIILTALAIEKKIASQVEFEGRVREILKTTQKSVLLRIIHSGSSFRSLLSNDRVLAEILMSLGSDNELKNSASYGLFQLLDEKENYFDLGETSRYCEQIFSTEAYRTHLVDPTKSKPAMVLQVMDALVLRVLQSQKSTPVECADAMSYLLNPESLNRVRKDAVAAIEKILIAMSKDEKLRSTDTRWHPSVSQANPPRSERAQEYDAMFINARESIPYSIFILRFISAANLTAELAQTLREFAKGCMTSIQPVEPELLTRRINSINANGWEASSIYSLKTKPLGWKKDFFAFHASIRLLQSNKLADIKDLVPNAPATVDEIIWEKTARLMVERDTDRSGDLDKDEFGKNGDFEVADKDGDGVLTEVEHYRYAMELVKKKPIEQAAAEIQSLVTALMAYKGSTGTFPNSLSPLWTKPEDAGLEWVKYFNQPVKNDPWGNPYKYMLDGPGFRIRSNGPDGMENTEDDLTNLE